MNIRHTLIIIVAALTGMASQAANMRDYPNIEKYVGPQAKPCIPATLQYMNDNDYYLQMNPAGTKISKYETRTGKEIEVVFDVANTRETSISRFDDFVMSADESKILISTDKKQIYRRSSDAVNYVYEIRSRLLKPLSTNHPRQQSPIFSPDGRMVAFVADNNIMIKKLDYGTEVNVTTDGQKNQIINGVADWTYEEEFTMTLAMSWSPDNTTLAFLKFNETDVPTYSFPLYEGACDKMKEYALYPGEYTYKYPVAGQKNSKVTLHSYDIDTRKIKDINIKDSRIEYIPNISYAYSSDRLMVVTLNRNQNRMEIYSVNPKSTVAKSVYVEESKTWIPSKTYESLTYTADSFVVLSSKSGYQHLYQYSYAGALMRTITSGDFDVTDYYGFNAANNCHYFCSTATGAINRVVSKIDKNGKRTDLSPASGYASATFSPSLKYYMLMWSDVNNAPTHKLYASGSEKPLRTFVDNKAYQADYADMPKKEFFTMTSDGYTLNGFIIKPSRFDSSNKYPVIMYQYSGPESQEVLNRWDVSWANYFAQAGYVIVCVDGRGTGGRGRAFCDIVYKRLGYYETIDQIAAAKYAGSLPYVDSSKIGIFGWSFGGYEAIMAASAPNAPYAAAVAVAPVTDWRYYDTVYAERYMQTPQENEDGYRQSSAMTHILDRVCPLLIMTGTADDNVHFFNTVQYVASCEEEGTWCDLLIFPNMNHFINRCHMRAVVYARMLDYFNRNLK